MFKQIKNYQLLVIPIILLLVHIGLGGTFLINGYGIGSSSEAELVSDIEVSVTWNHTYGGSQRDSCNSAIKTTDGGFLAVGSTMSFDINDTDLWLVKTDSNGNEQWNKTYGGNETENGAAVLETSDGAFVAVGNTLSFAINNQNIYLIKVSFNGTLQWNKTFGTLAYERGHSVIQTSDGGFLILGFSYYFDGELFQTVLFKTDSNGVHQWNQSYGGSDSDEAHSVIQTTDGGFLLVGETRSYGAGSDDMWFVKTSSDGSIQWNKTYGGTYADVGHSVIQTADESYLAVGYSCSYNPARTQVMWLLKTDSDGITQWNKSYTLMSNFDWARSVVQVDDGYLMVGFTTYKGERVDDDMWLVKTDFNGNEQWNKTLGGPSYEFGKSLIVLTSESIVVAGTTGSYGAGDSDMWLVKLQIPPPETTTTESSSSDSIPGFELFLLITAMLFLALPTKWVRKQL